MHAQLLHRKFLHFEKLRMLDHELMPNRENGCGVAMQDVVNAYERFEEIDDEIGTRAIDGVANDAKALTNFRSLRRRSNNGSPHRNAAIFFLRKGRAGDALKFWERLFEERGQGTFRISAGENRYNFMPVALEDLFHGDGLRHVAT